MSVNNSTNHKPPGENSMQGCGRTFLHGFFFPGVLNLRNERMD
jgi:hypothetical protein